MNIDDNKQHREWPPSPVRDPALLTPVFIDGKLKFDRRLLRQESSGMRGSRLRQEGEAEAEKVAFRASYPENARELDAEHGDGWVVTTSTPSDGGDMVYHIGTPVGESHATTARLNNGVTAESRLNEVDPPRVVEVPDGGGWEPGVATYVGVGVVGWQALRHRRKVAGVVKQGVQKGAGLAGRLAADLGKAVNGRRTWVLGEQGRRFVDSQGQRPRVGNRFAPGPSVQGPATEPAIKRVPNRALHETLKKGGFPKDVQKVYKEVADDLVKEVMRDKGVSRGAARRLVKAMDDEIVKRVQHGSKGRKPGVRGNSARYKIDLQRIVQRTPSLRTLAGSGGRLVYAAGRQLVGGVLKQSSNLLLPLFMAMENKSALERESGMTVTELLDAGRVTPAQVKATELLGIYKLPFSDIETGEVTTDIKRWAITKVLSSPWDTLGEFTKGALRAEDANPLLEIPLVILSGSFNPSDRRRKRDEHEKAYSLGSRLDPVVLGRDHTIRLGKRLAKARAEGRDPTMVGGQEHVDPSSRPHPGYLSDIEEAWNLALSPPKDWSEEGGVAKMMDHVASLGIEGQRAYFQFQAVQSRQDILTSAGLDPLMAKSLAEREALWDLGGTTAGSDPEWGSLDPDIAVLLSLRDSALTNMLFEFDDDGVPKLDQYGVPVLKEGVGSDVGLLPTFEQLGMDQSEIFHKAARGPDQWVDPNLEAAMSEEDDEFFEYLRYEDYAHPHMEQLHKAQRRLVMASESISMADLNGLSTFPGGSAQLSRIRSYNATIDAVIRGGERLGVKFSGKSLGEVLISGQTRLPLHMYEELLDSDWSNQEPGMVSEATLDSIRVGGIISRYFNNVLDGIPVSKSPTTFELPPHLPAFFEWVAKGYTPSTMGDYEELYQQFIVGSEPGQVWGSSPETRRLVSKFYRWSKTARNNYMGIAK